MKLAHSATYSFLQSYLNLVIGNSIINVLESFNSQSFFWPCRHDNSSVLIPSTNPPHVPSNPTTVIATYLYYWPYAINHTHIDNLWRIASNTRISASSACSLPTADCACRYCAYLQHVVRRTEKWSNLTFCYL